MSAWLVLELGALAPETRVRFPAASLFIEVVPGLGGAWTELTPEGEVVRFGVPESTSLKWFCLDRIEGADNVLSLALRRIVYARQRLCLAVVEPSLMPTVQHAVASYGGLVRVEARRAQESREAFAARISAIAQEAVAG